MPLLPPQRWYSNRNSCISILIQWQKWILNSINQIHKAALHAWTLCTSKGRELYAILRSSQLNCGMPLLVNRKWWIEECMRLKFTLVISCPFSCLCPDVYEKSVFKTILLYSNMCFCSNNWSLSLFRKAVVASYLAMIAQQLGSITAGQTVWVLSPLQP